MAKKMTPSQFRQAVNKYNSQVKRYNAEIKRKVDNYNRQAKKYNADLNRAIDNYNREVRKYNAQQQARKQKLRSAINQLNRTSSTSYSNTMTIKQSTQILYQKNEALESYVDAYSSDTYNDLLIDFPDQETTNSIMLYNSLAGVDDGQVLPPQLLQRTIVENALYEVSNEIGKRWEGAIYSLNPNNPDAARHFCTSVREIFIQLLDIKAPDSIVELHVPDCQYHNGRPNRRSKIKYILSLKSLTIDPLTDFVDTDISDVLNLFDELNSGTHGRAGKFTIQQLLKLKKRAEDTIIYITSISSN